MCDGDEGCCCGEPVKKARKPEECAQEKAGEHAGEEEERPREEPR